MVNTPITNATRDYLRDAIRRAEAEGAAALLIEMDTPGGLLEATRGLVQSMLEARVPIVVYVAPPGARAGSAGVFITLAAHVAAMAPTTHIGAAHPVSLFGGAGDEVMKRKVENDTAAWARTLAQARGRNADWAEKSVRESASLPADEALAAHVVDLIAPDVTALLRATDGRTVRVGPDSLVLRTAGAHLQEFARTGRQRVAGFLADPDLLFLALLLGLFLLFLEFKSPGLVVPGVVGALLLLLVLAVQVLPVNWVGVLLILGAVALFITEIYVSSFGLLAVGGLACLVVGSYLLFDVPGSSLRVAPQVAWSVALTFAALLLGVGYLLVRAKRQGPTSGVEAMAGEVGVLTQRVAAGQAGRLFLRGAYWTATSDHALEEGARVRVVRMEGTRAVVAPADPGLPNPGPEAPGEGG
ncbi:MAG: NfeD family protein [Candidatus Latescibacterota bacterium]